MKEHNIKKIIETKEKLKKIDVSTKNDLKIMKDKELFKLLKQRDKENRIKASQKKVVI